MSKLPATIEEWTAPWEKDGETFDASTAKTWAFNLQKAVEREEDAHGVTKASLQTATDEKGQLEVKVTALEADTKVDDLKRENATLKAQAEAANQNARKTMIDAVKAEFGLTDKQAAKLDGADLEALRTDANETFGPPKSAEAPEGETPEQKVAREAAAAAAGGNSLNGPQRVGYRNAGDPADSGPPSKTKDEALAEIMAD